MGAITATKVVNTEGAGEVKLAAFTATIASATDTVDLSSYFDTLYAVVPVLEAGADAECLPAIQASFSGTTATLKTFEQDGTVATDFTGTTVRLLVLGAN